MLLVSLLWFDFPDLGGPEAFDIHDVHIVPADVVISDVNGVSAVGGLTACC